MQGIKEPDNGIAVGHLPEGMICRGCGNPVKEVPQYYSSKLRRRFDEEHEMPLRSFQCDQCEVILFSDELPLGRFVPPQFRVETTEAQTVEPERLPPPSFENSIVVAVEVSRAFRRTPE